MAWSCRSHSPPWSQIGQSSGWLISKNSITPSRAFFTIGERVSSTFVEPSLFAIRSRPPRAHDACGFGGPPTTSIRHMRQLPAIESRSWKQKRGISTPAASHARSSVLSGGTAVLGQREPLVEEEARHPPPPRFARLQQRVLGRNVDLGAVDDELGHALPA